MTQTICPHALGQTRNSVGDHGHQRPSGRFLMLLALSLMLFACAGPEVPRDHFYRLTAGPAPTSHSSERILPGTVLVERFTTLGIPEGRELLFSDITQPFQVNRYSYHFWVESPGILFQEAMATFLSSARIAKQVLTPQSRTRAEYILTGKIHRLEHIIGTSPTRIVVKVEFLLQQATAHEAPILHKIYEEERDLSEEASLGPVADSLNSAFHIIQQHFLKDLQAVLSTSS